MTDPDINGFVDHAGVDLWRAWRAYEAAMYERVAALGFPDIAVADGDILVHITAAGTPFASLAKTRGLSKQAVHERVHSLVKRGYLELMPDPGDKRARIVRHTARGQELVERLKDVKRALHREVEGALGKVQLTTLRQMLAKISGILT